MDKHLVLRGEENRSPSAEGRGREKKGAFPIKLTTGLDLIEIGRVEKSLKNPRFLKRVFSQEERLLFAKRRQNAATIAANFAAKEAFSKAMGTGFSGFGLDEVSALRDSRGCPYLLLTGRAKELAGTAQLSVSLTHTACFAAATVTALWEEEPGSR